MILSTSKFILVFTLIHSTLFVTLAQAEPQALCSVRTVKQYRPSIDQPKRNDKFKHCALSCVIALQCGPVQSWGAGVAKEIADLIGPGSPDVKDLRANRMGIQMVIRRYAHSPQECIDQCIRVFPNLKI